MQSVFLSSLQRPTGQDWREPIYWFGVVLWSGRGRIFKWPGTLVGRLRINELTGRKLV